MASKDRFQRNTGDKPDPIPPGDRFIASGQPQSPGKRAGSPSPGGRKASSRDDATPIADREPRERGANPTLSRSGEVDTSGLNGAGGQDPDRLPPPRSQRERGNPNADESVRSYKGRDPEA